MRSTITYNEQVTKTVGGVVYCEHVCGRCGGSGYLPGYEFSDGARCWGCAATGGRGWIALATVVARREKREKARARREARKAEALASWKAENAEVVAGLTGYTGTNPFLWDMKERLAEGPLTAKQADAAVKALAREAERTAKREAEAADLRERGVEVPTGRVVVEGVARSFKSQESIYGTTVKMLVVTDDGWKVYGTLPSAFYGIEVGTRVRFTARTEPSTDDPAFGFYSRPTKPEVVATEAD